MNSPGRYHGDPTKLQEILSLPQNTFLKIQHLLPYER